MYVHYRVQEGTEEIEAKDVPVVFPAGDSQTTWSYATENDQEDKPDLEITAWLRDPEDGQPPWPLPPTTRTTLPWLWLRTTMSPL